MPCSKMALLNDIVSCDSGALSDRDIYQITSDLLNETAEKLL